MIYQRVMLILITVMIFWGSVFSQNSQLIPTNHGVIHYKIFGKGKPLVIINGGPGMNSEGFAGLAEQLAKEGFLCIIYDQRGTGKSEMKKSRFHHDYHEKYGRRS
jgi:proline iminopeptidase